MDEYDYLPKLIVFGDRGVGKTTLEKHLDQVNQNNRRDSFKDRIRDFDKKIDDYHILRGNSRFIFRRRYYSSRIKREIEKKNRYLNYGESDFDSQTSLRTTIGVNFRWKFLKIGDIGIKWQIWVLGCQEHFRSIRKMYLRGVNSALLLYDITNASSLHKIPEWCEMIANHCGDIPVVLIGNKLDLEEQREISKEMGEEVQKQYNISSFMEISAETGENIEQMFKLIGELYLNRELNERPV